MKSHKPILLKRVHIYKDLTIYDNEPDDVKKWRLIMRKKTYLNNLPVLRKYFKKKYNAEYVYFTYEHLTN